MAKLKRKHLEPIDRSLDRLFDTLADHGIVLSRMEVELGKKRTLQTDLDRIETLMGGVKTALERMGGNTMPSAMQDVHALRSQMSEFRSELADYRGALMRLSNWLDEINHPPPEPPEQQWFKPKRKYNRRKKGAQEDQPSVEISVDDAALHTDQPEDENGA
jgi:hypothetical protein